MRETDNYLTGTFGVSAELIEDCREAEAALADRFAQVDEIAACNQMKVLSAMQAHRLSDAHFAGTNGYGYNDLGRDALEAIYATVFHTEAALVRPMLISGTHALTVALSGNLRAGDELLSPVGAPYDTLQGVIGIRPTRGSLAEQGVVYRQVDLLPDGGFDYPAIAKALGPKTKLVTIQRSKGYAFRESFSVEKLGQLIAFIKSVKPDVACMVDNCYGEFTETIEPTDVGADLVVGSLIKNPGGGLAPIGGYIAGKTELVENAAYRLTAPGLGREVGASLGLNQILTQGLFFAPQVVSGAVKGAMLLAALLEKHGFATCPRSTDPRVDIVQAAVLETPENVVAFCGGIQKAAPVDSFAAPEPWPMPGYGCDVIMAAGAFVQGASIELSADAPMRPPYIVYYQGGLTYPHAKLGALMGVQALLDRKEDQRT